MMNDSLAIKAHGITREFHSREGLALWELFERRALSTGSIARF